MEFSRVEWSGGLIVLLATVGGRGGMLTLMLTPHVDAEAGGS